MFGAKRDKSESMSALLIWRATRMHPRRVVLCDAKGPEALSVETLIATQMQYFVMFSLLNITFFYIRRVRAL